MLPLSRSSTQQVQECFVFPLEEAYSLTQPRVLFKQGSNNTKILGTNFILSILKKKSYKLRTIIKRTIFPERGLRNVTFISYTVGLQDDLTSHRGILLLLNNYLLQ